MVTASPVAACVLPLRQNHLESVESIFCKHNLGKIMSLLHEMESIACELL